MEGHNKVMNIQWKVQAMREREKELRTGSSRMAVLKIFAGVFLLAFTTNVMYEPANMVTGGFSGLAIIIKRLTAVNGAAGIPVWFTTTVLNIPLFLVALKMTGWKYLKKSLFSSVLFSVFLSLIPKLDILGGDMLLTSVFGGVLMGVSRGLMFSVNSTTGGADLMAALIHRKLRYYTVAEVVQAIDAIIILFGIWAFGIKMALYAVIAIVIATKISDWMIEGIKISKMSYIISDKNDEIASKIINELGRGVTRISVSGGYSGEKREMLVCVTSKKEIVRLKETAASVDKGAFVIVSDVREVFGKGFIENN